MEKLKIGDPAPEFEAVNESNTKISLRSFRGKKVILYFYPKDHTPGCTKQACGFRDRYAEVQRLNAVVIGVSPDESASHDRFKADYSLPFTLVVDADHRIAEQYGVWGEQSLFGIKYMGIARSHFVIGEDGKLLDVQYKISPKDSVAEAVKALA